LPEFTGERVIPNQVDPDLWNEHLSRYLFAARLSAHRRVLDLACGTGYGSAELARTAATVTGVDISPDAIAYAREHFPRSNLSFLQADVQAVPLPDASFDLITAFEVIEHLPAWHSLLSEAARLLAPGGQFLVSTPNKAYYADTRKAAGPNPYHVHEFDFEEFFQALRDVFPHVTIWLQNHAESVVFQPLGPSTASHLSIQAARPDPAAAHFYLGVCAASPMIGAPTFLYLPSSGNVLRERELHIAGLESELAKKDAWLAESQAAHQTLVSIHSDVVAELESRNRWAGQLNEELALSAARILELQQELERDQLAIRDMAAAYEKTIADLDRDFAAHAKCAQETEARLTEDVRQSNRLLELSDQTVEERTRWALDLQRQLDSAQAQLSGYLASRWTKLGRTFGLGPKTSG
jgi:ubiquinone/menaquinone biosynthesis C-methylase UbiE